jgi:hypothetical protein
MGFGTYGALGGVNLGRRLGVKSRADPQTNNLKRLNIGMNTVQTYRKRAYTRLSISSQNELMRLVMS